MLPRRIEKLLTRGQPAEKHRALLAELNDKFKAARSMGHCINFHWWWSCARVIDQAKTGKESKFAKSVVKSLKRYDIKMRAKQRDMKTPKESYRATAKMTCHHS